MFRTDDHKGLQIKLSTWKCLSSHFMSFIWIKLVFVMSLSINLTLEKMLSVRKQESIEILLPLLINDPEWGIIKCIHQGTEVYALTQTCMIKLKEAKDFCNSPNLWTLDGKITLKDWTLQQSCKFPMLQIIHAAKLQIFMTEFFFLSKWRRKKQIIVIYLSIHKKWSCETG